MNNELEKRFPFKETEENLILNWKNDNVFKFKNSQKEDYKTNHAADKSGKSKTDNTQYTFKSGGHSRVTCTDWSNNMNYVDKLTVSVVTKEFEN